MKTIASSKRFRRSLSAVTMLCGLALLSARADLLELVNGDSYRGTVVSLNLTNVEFQSEIQGRVLLPRAKVARITFREPVVNHAGASNVAPVGAPLIIRGTNTANVPTGNAVTEQMRRQGVDPKLVSQVQEQIFGKASPEASQKFDELMSGLTSGSLNIGDIRAQAQTAINNIKAAKKDLGPDAGDMLDGYLAILEKFVQESATDTNNPFAKTPSGVK